MDLSEARERVLALLREKGKVKNSELLLLLDNDEHLLTAVREDLIFDDLAQDKNGVGLVYISGDGTSAEDSAAGPVLSSVTAVPASAKGKLRIFISYGHDTNEELVTRIKADLENRGHDVWFDKSEIRAGDDWRRSITEGIVDIHRVLSFLSRHSTRDPGVCLDELSIAIGVKGGNIQTVYTNSPLKND